MNQPTIIARRSDGTVATEHHAKLSRTHRSQFVAEGAKTLILAVIRSLSGRAEPGHLSGAA